MSAERSTSSRSRKKSYRDNIGEREISRRARRSALIQLKLGRAAHSLSALASVLLAFAAVFIFLLTNYLSESLRTTLEDAKWLIPLFIGAIISFIIIVLKWEPFMTDRGSKHFIVSYIALAVPLGLIATVVLQNLGYFNLGTGNWIYPLSFIGISLSFVSIAMIWEGMSRRKTISVIAAIIPTMIMIAPALFRADMILDILPIVYLGSAVCIQLSGSMMHLISTATSVQEREILKASDSKIISLRDELQVLQEEIEFRDKALREREIEVEAYEKTLNDKNLEIEQRIRLMERMETERANREERLLQERKRIKSDELEIAKREELFEQEKLELESEKEEMNKISEAFLKKSDLFEKEKARIQEDMAKAKMALDQLERRKGVMEDERNTLTDLRGSIISEKKQLAERAKELDLKNSALEMRLKRAETSTAVLGDETARLKKLSEWEERILQKEREIALKETELSKAEIENEQRVRQAKAAMKSGEQRIAQMDQREKEIAEMESMLRNMEREIAREKIQIQEAKSVLESSRDQIASLKDKYEFMIERAGKRGESFADKEGLVEKRMAALDEREGRVKALQERLKAELAEMERRRRELIGLDKQMSAKNSQLKMKELELKDRRRQLEEMLTSGAVSSPEQMTDLLEDLKQRELTQKIREKMLFDKETALKKKAYDMSKGEETYLEEEEAVPSEISGKLSTGTKRLDDLLLGGIPKGSSVLFVGPSFSGKEVGILSFLADGLKNEVPIILITTSKSPQDLAKDFAPIFPAFLDMERVGLVRWIDATTGDDSKKRASSQRKNIARVDGPDDLPGIIEGIEGFIEDVGNGGYPYFKLGFLSLSTSIAHSDEMEMTKFIQAMARIIRGSNSAGIFALEKGMHSEQQINSIQHLMDGAISIKLDKQKSLLSVVGITDVQTRDWIEFRQTNKALIIGAFSLERIR